MGEVDRVLNTVLVFCSSSGRYCQKAFSVLLGCLFPGSSTRVNRLFLEFFWFARYRWFRLEAFPVPCVGYMEGKGKIQRIQPSIMPPIPGSLLLHRSFQRLLVFVLVTCPALVKKKDLRRIGLLRLPEQAVFLQTISFLFYNSFIEM